MNFDDSANPNRSLSSMPDHSQAQGDFQNYSVNNSSVPQSPSTSTYQKKPNKRTSSISQSGVSRSSAYPNYASNDASEAQQSNYYDRTENDNWIRDPYDERARERRLNPGSEQRGSTRGSSRFQSNLQASPFGNEEPEPEVDHSYKTFLKLKRLYIYVIFNIVCIFIMGLNIFFAYSTDQTHFNFLEAVDAQFQSHLIIDMNLMERSSDCTGLYANTRMGQWPGYERICECDSNVNAGECTSHQSAVGCKTLGPLEPVNIALWDSKKICVRRSEGSVKDYYQKLIVNSVGESTCEDDLKKCIVSSNGNAVCMGRFEFCPVTKIIVDEGPSNDTTQKKWKGQLHFPNKTFLYENEENKGTSLMDLVVREDECARYQEKAAISACESEKLLLDRQSEYAAVKDNAQQPEDYEVLKNMQKNVALYGQSADYLEMCRFNKTFNPIILSNELGNWDRVKTLRFVNPFFICSLLIINYVRTSVLDYLNTKTSARVFIKRKKELYNVFGFFTGSSVMITCQVLIILYYIFWGYLLLNQSRLIGQRWLDMSCITGELRKDIQLMMGEISKVEAYNMVTIGPMIVCCILEALFAQYKMIKLEVMDQLRD